MLDMSQQCPHGKEGQPHPGRHQCSHQIQGCGLLWCSSFKRLQWASPQGEEPKLLRTRFTGGRWGKVARSRAVAQDTWAGRGCRRCTCSGEIIWLSKTAWWHVHEIGATLFSEVKSERTRGRRHKLEHGKCQLSIRKKLPWAYWMLEHTVQGVCGISILRNMLKECHQLSAQTGLALSQGLDHRTPTDPFHLTLS